MKDNITWLIRKGMMTVFISREINTMSKLHLASKKKCSQD